MISSAMKISFQFNSKQKESSNITQIDGEILNRWVQSRRFAKMMNFAAYLHPIVRLPEERSPAINIVPEIFNVYWYNFDVTTLVTYYAPLTLEIILLQTIITWHFGAWIWLQYTVQIVGITVTR